MANLARGNYNGTIASTEWFKTRKGTVGLNVFVDIPTVGGEPERMKGTIWISPKTTKGRERKDGSIGRSMVEEQLSNCGYTGDMAGIQEIGYTIDLIGNDVRVNIKEDDSDYGNGEMRIAFFNAKQMRQEAVAGALASLLGTPAPQEEPEGDDDVPAAAPEPAEIGMPDDDDGSVPF